MDVAYIFTQLLIRVRCPDTSNMRGTNHGHASSGRFIAHARTQATAIIHEHERHPRLLSTPVAVGVGL